jgi:hypothetical protein
MLRVTTMTTDPWRTTELMEVTARGGRADTVLRLAERVQTAMRAGGAHTAVASFWTPAAIPDTRLSRAKGFWKARRDLAAIVPASADLSEAPHAGADGLRFFACVRVSLEDLGDLLVAALTYERNRACILVPLRALPSEGFFVKVRDALAAARFEAEILGTLSAEALGESCVVVVPAGRYDDPECGLLLHGPSSLLGTIEGVRDVSC